MVVGTGLFQRSVAKSTLRRRLWSIPSAAGAVSAQVGTIGTVRRQLTSPWESPEDLEALVRAGAPKPT